MSWSNAAGRKSEAESAPVQDPLILGHFRRVAPRPTQDALQSIWRTEPGGALVTEADGFRLVVHRTEAREEPIRFMVLRRQYGTGSPFALVCCGTETDVRKAMAAAEEQAYRLGASAPTLCGT